MTTRTMNSAVLRVSTAGLAVLMVASAATPDDAGAPSAEPAKPAMVAAIAVSPDGKWIAAATGSYDQPGELVLWDMAARRPKWAQRYDIGIRSTAISPDGKLIAAGHFDGHARLKIGRAHV